MVLFKDEAHRHLFEEKRAGLHAIQNEDSRFLSVIYIMTSTPGLYGLIDNYIKLGETQETAIHDDYELSNQQKILADLATNLFSGGSEVSPIDLISMLSHDSFNVAMNAIYIRKTGAI